MKGFSKCSVVCRLYHLKVQVRMSRDGPSLMFCLKSAVISPSLSSASPFLQALGNDMFRKLKVIFI